MAGQTYNLKTLLTVTDKLSPTLQKIQKSYAGVAMRMRAVNRAAGNVGKSLAGLRSVFTPLTIAAGALGFSIVGGTKAFAAYADSLAAVSDKTGVATKSLQELRYAAAVNGSSAAEMDAALTKLNKTMADAAAGNNARVASLFKTLGISLKDAKGNVRSVADVMPQLAEAMRLNTNPALRTQMAMDLFGQSGAKLLPLLKQGSAGLQAMSKRAQDLGLVVSDDAVKAGGDLNNTLAELDMAVNATTGEISKSLAPVIKSISESLMVWIKENRELIAVNIAEWVKRISEALKAVPWDMVITGLEVIGSAIVAGKIANLASTLFMLGKAVMAATGPWGLLIAAVVAVVAAVVANWDKIVEVTTRMASEAMKVFSAIGAAFMDSVQDAVNAVTGWISGLVNVFSNVWENIKGVCSAAIDKIKGIFPAWLQKVLGGSGKHDINVNTQGAPGAQPQPLTQTNQTAMGLSAAGAVTGSVDVNLRNQNTGTTETHKASLRGQVRVSGNPGEMRPAYAYGGD